jgi:hypothetical protein
MAVKKTMKAALAEDIAKRLDAHLKRMEADPKINKKNKYGATLWHPHAWADRGMVAYNHKPLGLNGGIGVPIDRALPWVEWLDQGNSGLLHEFEKKFPPVEVRYVSIPDVDHRHRFDGLRGRRYQKLEDAFYAMLQLLFPAVPKPEGGGRVHELSGWSHIGKGHPKPTYHVMSEEQQKAVEQLFTKIREGLDTSFNDGKQDGQDFLQQMVRGEITIDGFGIKGKPATRDYAGRMQDPDK